MGAEDQVHGNGNRRPAATIYDVARVTGVSPSTVSRALNKPGRINARTEERVRREAEKLGYRTNPMARAVITGRTNTIALLLSDITNPVYFDLIRGSEHVSAAHDRTLVLAESQESAPTERAAAQRLQPSVDGVILVASRLDDDSIRKLAETKPLVMVNRRVEGIDSLVPNIEPGLASALDHLRDLGHRAIGYLSGPADSWMNRYRWDTLFELALERRLNIVEIGPSAPTLDGGTGVLRKVLAAGVSAVIAYNDLIALGLLRQCQAEGVVVPNQLSIIGFDDIFGSDLTTPALTTIRSPLAELGAAAVEVLLGLNGDQPSTAPTEFVARASTAPPRSTRSAH